MTDLAAHGISVNLPSGWEGRCFRRPNAGEVAAADVQGAPAAPLETTNAVLHVSTIALPPGIGDFASGAVDRLGNDDVLVVLFEYDPASASQPLFASAGIPRTLTNDDFSPNMMQRAIRGQAGAQRFFNVEGRAFCLYAVLGAFARRDVLVPRVNQVLATLTIEPRDGASSTSTVPSTTSTTVAPTPTPTPTTTEAPTTSSTTAPSTTAPPLTTPDGR